MSASSSAVRSAHSGHGPPCWSQDVLQWLHGSKKETDHNKKTTSGTMPQCAFCLTALGRTSTESDRAVRCSRCVRAYHSSCVVIEDAPPSDGDDAPPPAFVCGFCSPLGSDDIACPTSDPPQCALCHQPAHTSEGQYGHLVGPFKHRTSWEPERTIYVHPQCAWWSNQFPWSELAMSPSSLKCAGCGKGNASIRCTGCVRRERSHGLGHHHFFGNCRRRYHYPCAAAAGLLQPGVLPSTFTCADQSHVQLAASSADRKPPSDGLTTTSTTPSSPSGRKRRRGGHSDEGEVEELRRRLADQEAQYAALQAHYAKARADRAELVERLELMADRAQEAQDYIADLESKLASRSAPDHPLEEGQEKGRDLSLNEPPTDEARRHAEELREATEREMAVQEKLDRALDQLEARERLIEELRHACSQLEESVRKADERLAHERERLLEAGAEAEQRIHQATEQSRILLDEKENAQAEIDQLKETIRQLMEQHEALETEHRLRQARNIPEDDAPLQDSPCHHQLQAEEEQAVAPPPGTRPTDEDDDEVANESRLIGRQIMDEHHEEASVQEEEPAQDHTAEHDVPQRDQTDGEEKTLLSESDRARGLQEAMANFSSEWAIIEQERQKEKERVETLIQRMAALLSSYRSPAEEALAPELTEPAACEDVATPAPEYVSTPEEGPDVSSGSDDLPPDTSSLAPETPMSGPHDEVPDGAESDDLPHDGSGSDDLPPVTSDLPPETPLSAPDGRSPVPEGEVSDGLPRGSSGSDDLPPVTSDLPDETLMSAPDDEVPDAGSDGLSHDEGSPAPEGSSGSDGLPHDTPHSDDEPQARDEPKEQERPPPDAPLQCSIDPSEDPTRPAETEPSSAGPRKRRRRGGAKKRNAR